MNQGGKLLGYYQSEWIWRPWSEHTSTQTSFDCPALSHQMDASIVPKLHFYKSVNKLTKHIISLVYVTSIIIIILFYKGSLKTFWPQLVHLPRLLRNIKSLTSLKGMY